MVPGERAAVPSPVDRDGWDAPWSSAMRDLWLSFQALRHTRRCPASSDNGTRPTGGGLSTPGDLVVPAVRPTPQRGSRSRPTDSSHGAPDPNPGSWEGRPTMLLSRRQFLVGSAAAGTGLFLVSFAGGTRIVRAVPIAGASLDPEDITKYVTPLLIPPVMPRAGTIPQRGRQADRLLRDLDAAALAADPADRPAADDGLGLRRGHRASATAGSCSTTLRRSRSRRVGTGRSGSSGSTSSWTRTGTTCRTFSRSTQRSTGRTRPVA